MRSLKLSIGVLTTILAGLGCDDSADAPLVEALPLVATATLSAEAIEAADAAEAAEAAIITAAVDAPDAEFLQPSPDAFVGPPAPEAKEEPRLRVVDVKISGALEGALRSAIKGDEAPALAQVVKRVLVWWLNPRRDLRRGDRLRVVYEVPEQGEPVAHAVWLDSEKFGAKQAVRYKAPGAAFARWYDGKGNEIALRLKHSPIGTYEQITSLLRDGRGHKGMDFKAPIGTKITAPFGAIVKRKNWSRRRNGNCLHLRTPRGIDIFLLHLDKIDPSIKAGMRVRRGQVLARSGNTGRSFAPHLHYQLEKAGRVLDPLKIHDSYRKKLGPEGRSAVQRKLAHWAAWVAEASST